MRALLRVLTVLVAVAAVPFAAGAAQGNGDKCKAEANPAGRGVDQGWRARPADQMPPGQAKKCPAPAPADEPPPPPPPAVGIHQVHGLVFDDMNGDGQRDMFDDAGLFGWTIRLSGTVSRTVTTDINGNYVIDQLPNGTYTVCQVLQAGYNQTLPAGGGCHSFPIQGTLETWVSNINFANQAVPTP